jgi:hypothetical protein
VTLHEEAELRRGAVRLGVARLNKRAQHWRKHIDTHELDMRSPKHCVLAQVYGNYYAGLEIVGPFWWKFVPWSFAPLKWDRYQQRWAMRHGFNLPGGSDAAWWGLNHAWGEEMHDGGAEGRE